MEVVRVTCLVLLLGGTAAVFGATLVFSFAVAPTLLRHTSKERGASVLAHALGAHHRVVVSGAVLAVVGGALAWWLLPAQREGLGVATVLQGVALLSLLHLGRTGVRPILEGSPGPAGWGEGDTTAARAQLEALHVRVASRYGLHLLLSLGALVALAATAAS